MRFVACISIHPLEVCPYFVTLKLVDFYVKITHNIKNRTWVFQELWEKNYGDLTIVSDFCSKYPDCYADLQLKEPRHGSMRLMPLEM